jgi:acetyl esterase/lipase
MTIAMLKTVTPPASRSADHALTAPTPQSQPLPRRTPTTRRKTIDKVRAIDTSELVDVQDVTVPGGPVGQTWLRIVRPAGSAKPLPVVLYIHGDNAVFGNPHTRRQATKLATDLTAALVIVDYSLSPNARFPIAIEENYAAAVWVAEHGNEHSLDGTRIAVTADPAGANMADELMIMTDQRGGPTLAAHVLFSPKATAVLRAALTA